MVWFQNIHLPFHRGFRMFRVQFVFLREWRRGYLSLGPSFFHALLVRGLELRWRDRPWPTEPTPVSTDELHPAEGGLPVPGLRCFFRPRPHLVPVVIWGTSRLVSIRSQSVSSRSESACSPRSCHRTPSVAGELPNRGPPPSPSGDRSPLPPQSGKVK